MESTCSVIHAVRTGVYVLVHPRNMGVALLCEQSPTHVLDYQACHIVTHAELYLQVSFQVGPHLLGLREGPLLPKHV